MLTLQYAEAEPDIKSNAVEPGYTDTDFNAAVPGGRPTEQSAKGVERMATIDDGPTGQPSRTASRCPGCRARHQNDR